MLYSTYPTTGQLKSYHVVVGKVPSLNAFYASKHWTVRAKAKDKHCAEVLAQLEEYDCVPIQHVYITCKVNYRYDIDNSIMAVKFALKSNPNASPSQVASTR